MPFAELPGSHIQGLQTPDWTRFAAQANEMIANQKHPDLSESILQAANQINEVMKMSSPEAKMERALKREFLKTQVQMYQEYKTNPDAFEFKNGTLQRRDKYKNILEAVRFSNGIKQGKLLDARLATSGGVPVDNMMRSSSARFRQQAPAGKDTYSAPVLSTGGAIQEGAVPDSTERTESSDLYEDVGAPPDTSGDTE